MGRWAGLAVALFAVLFSVRAEAAPRRARVVIDACAAGPVEGAEVARLVALELVPSGVVVVESGDAELFLTVSVPGCSATSTEVDLAAVAGASGRTARVVLERSGATVANPGSAVVDRRLVARRVALAAAELVRDLEVAHAPSVKTATAWAPTAAWEESIIARAAERARSTQPAISRPARPKLDLALGVDAYPSVSSALGALHLDLDVLGSTTAATRLVVGAVLRFGLVRDPRGLVDLGAACGSIALRREARLDGGRGGALIFAIGPRVVAGWATAGGRPEETGVTGSRVHAPLVEVWLDATLGVVIDDAWWARAEVRAGWVVAGLTAKVDGVDLTGLDGAALGASIGVGRSF